MGVTKRPIIWDQNIQNVTNMDNCPQNKSLHGTPLSYILYLRSRHQLNYPHLTENVKYKTINKLNLQLRIQYKTYMHAPENYPESV